MANLIATLQARGLVVDALARPEARRIFELWCDTFLQGVQQRTRQFRHRGLHWHAFSDGIVAAVEREEALDRYRRTAAEPVWI